MSGSPSFNWTVCNKKLWDSKIDVFGNNISQQISRREKELSKPNPTSHCSDVLVQLNFVSTNTIYLNKLAYWMK